MYPVIANCLFNVAGVPFGPGAVPIALGGWAVVAAFLISLIILSTCVDRSARLSWPDRSLGGASISRIEQGFWGLRLRCAEVLKNG